jgi:hypothetical protein
LAPKLENRWGEYNVGPFIVSSNEQSQSCRALLEKFIFTDALESYFVIIIVTEGLSPCAQKSVFQKTT